MMRLPEAKIKVALVHPEKVARQEALHYFAKSFSRDTEVMPLAIHAVETYGRSNAFLYVHMLADLAQTDATVDWIVRELHQGGGPEDHDVFFPNLSRILCSADPQLLRPRATEITQAPGFVKELRSEFERRLQLATWDADRCWKELEDICDKVVSEGDSEAVDSGYASEVVEALARQGEQQVERILERLGKDVDDWETDPLAWMEIFLVELAGEMRLERAIPLIVRKLRRSEEILSEECVEALAKIGTDAAAEAVTEGWLEREWDYRLYATSALDGIHTDTTVKRCLELLPLDKDLDIRTKLADSLLAQFAEEGIEPVREMVQTRAYDATLCDLMDKLVAVSTIMGVTFPGFPVWKQEVEVRREKQEKQMKAMMGYSRLPTSARKPTAAPFREPDELAARKQPPFLRTEKQVGRNDPCPCGSGKKFKKCCIEQKQGLKLKGQSSQQE